MRIAIGCDDTGFPLKEQVSAALEASGHELLDLGTFSADPVDHPDYARAVGQAVLRGFVDTGMLICGSGAGASISGEERFTRKISKVALLEGGLPSPEKAPTRQATATAAGKPSTREVPVEATPRPVQKAQAAAPVAPPWPVQKMPMEAPLAPPPRPVQRMPIEVPVGSDAGGTIRMGDYVGATAPPATPRPVDEIFKLPAVQETLDALDAQDFLDRLWVKDASLWKGEAPAIRNRLGWLTSPTIMRGHTDDIKTFADEIRRLQFTHVVVLGMGGASLCGEVFNLAFGSKDR